MHVNLAFVLAAIDWNYALHQSPARIVAIAAFVATTLQGLKRYFPLLSGWWAIATNVCFSAALIIAATSPDQLLTPATVANLVIAVLGAAGIHGTGKIMFGDQANCDTPAPPNSLPTGATKLPILLLGVALLGGCAVGLGGCSDWERQTYQTLAATQAVINQAQDDYENGALPHNELAYEAINKAKDAQILAVKAFAAYKHLEDTKAPQSAIDAQVQMINQALQLLPGLIVDIKALYSSPARPMIRPGPANTSMLRFHPAIAA